MKHKTILPLLAATIAGTSAAPIITNCSPKSTEDTLKSIAANFQSGKTDFYLGEKLDPALFNVTATYESGKTELLSYDSTGANGYTIESQSFTVGQVFEAKDLSRDNVIRFNYKGLSSNLNFDIDYSKNVNFYLTNVVVQSISEVKQGSDIEIVYKPISDIYYTSFESTGVQIGTTTYNAYEEIFESTTPKISLEYVEGSNEDRTIKMTIKSDIVTSDDIKVQILDYNWEDACAIKFKAGEHCTLVGTTYQVVATGATWKDVLIKPAVKADDDYMFTKWVDQNGNEMLDTTEITDDLEVTAICEQVSVTVNFLHDEHCTIDASWTGEKKVPYGIRWGALVGNIDVTVINPDNYKFDDWYDSKTGNAIPADLKITSPFTAVATCKEISKIDVKFYAGSYGKIGGEEYATVTVPLGTLFGDIAKPEVTPDPDYVFDYWVDDNGNRISDTMVCSKDFQATAVYKTASRVIHLTMVTGNDSCVRAKDVDQGQRDSFLDLPYTDTIKGYDGGKQRAKEPELDTTTKKLNLSFLTHKTDDFRFITQTLQVTFTVKPHETRKIALNVKAKEYFSLNFWMFGTNIHTTVEFFKLDDENDHPTFYSNPSKDDESKRPVDEKCTYRKRVGKTVGTDLDWSTEWTQDNIMTFEQTNDTDEPVIYNRYFSVSFLVDREDGDDNANKEGNVTLNFDFTE